MSVLILTSWIAAAAFGAEPQDRYLTVVRRAADALLAEGVDDYGPQKSALILSVLDPKSGRPLAKLPKAPSGVRGSDRCPPYGSNANLQQDLYRTLDELSRITGDARYVQARGTQLGDASGGEAYRRLVVAAADLYARELPDAKSADLWAGEYGMVIFSEIAAYRLTGEPKYLEAAKTVADCALADLWAEGYVLPRASARTAHYEAISYPDTLLLSLLALHEHVAGLMPTVPISALCR